MQSVVWVEILGICVASSTFRVLLSRFWVSGLLFPSPKDPFPVPVPGFWMSGSRVPVSQGPRSKSPGCQDPRVPSLRVLGSWVSGLRVPDPGSQVLILDYAQIEIVFIKTSFKDSKKVEGIRNYVSK